MNNPFASRNEPDGAAVSIMGTSGGRRRWRSTCEAPPARETAHVANAAEEKPPSPTSLIARWQLMSHPLRGVVSNWSTLTEDIAINSICLQYTFILI